MVLPDLVRQSDPTFQVVHSIQADLAVIRYRVSLEHPLLQVLLLNHSSLWVPAGQEVRVTLDHLQGPLLLVVQQVRWVLLILLRLFGLQVPMVRVNLEVLVSQRVLFHQQLL